MSSASPSDDLETSKLLLRPSVVKPAMPRTVFRRRPDGSVGIHRSRLRRFRKEWSDLPRQGKTND